MDVLQREDVMALEQKYLAPTYKRAPIVFERGQGVTLYDSQGRAYLDFLAGIAVNSLGHQDPDVVAAIQEASTGLLHVTNLYHTEPHTLLARDLCESSFADRVFFCNSGTEAVEGALKFARKAHPEKAEFVAFTQAFHGRSLGALSVTHSEKYRKPFEPLLAGVRWAAFNDFESAASAIGPETAAVIVEPIQGEGGIVPASLEFLQGLRDLCTAAGAALIFDEVQCGVGRTGTLWAHEFYNVAPDIMTLAKPLGGGLPIGAILMTESVATALAPGDHGSTFAAGPFVTRVSRVVFSKIKQPSMLQHVQDVGRYLGDRLARLAEKHPDRIVGVRGRGLMWGIQLRESFPVDKVVTAGYERGIVVGSSGGNTVRLVPPLIVGTKDVDTVVAALDAILEVTVHEDS